MTSDRRESESNRRRRLCRPLHDHSAIPPRDGRPTNCAGRRNEKSNEKGEPHFRRALPRKSGAGNESRTRDLNLGKVALYQLSYSRVGQLQIIAQRVVVFKASTPRVAETHGIGLRYQVIALVANSLTDGVFTSAECMRVIAFSKL